MGLLEGVLALSLVGSLCNNDPGLQSRHKQKGICVTCLTTPRVRLCGRISAHHINPCALDSTGCVSKPRWLHRKKTHNNVCLCFLHPLYVCLLRFLFYWIHARIEGHQSKMTRWPLSIPEKYIDFCKVRAGRARCAPAAKRGRVLVALPLDQKAHGGRGSPRPKRGRFHP